MRRRAAANGRRDSRGSLAGKSAIVTGGSRGIGAAIVSELASFGASVLFTYHSNREAAVSLEINLASAPGGVAAFQADVRDFSAAARAVAAAEEKFGGVDILVNNAGFISNRSFAFMTREEWRDAIDTDLHGAFNFSKAVLRGFCREQWGRIINISSVAAFRGMEGYSHHAAAKAAVLALTRTLAREVARFGVTVNAVAPGCIEAGMWAQIPPRNKELLLAAVPMGRPGTAREFASVAAFLASEEASYVTGQVFAVDGGMTA